jgi:hypothetical protein
MFSSKLLQIALFGLTLTFSPLTCQAAANSIDDGSNLTDNSAAAL